MRTDQDRAREAVRAFADAVPVVPPPVAAIRARAARAGVALRPRRRVGRWLAPALAATAILAMVAVVTVVPGVLGPGSGDDSGDDAQPVLPERFAGLSRWTAAYEDSPPGPAIALYHQGSLQPAGRDNSQQLVVGADGRTYRELRWATTEGVGAEQPWNAVGEALLSPDGSLLAVPGSLAGSNISVIDLTTGAVDRYPDVTGEILAWSLDGRRIAFRRGALVGESDVAVLDLDARGISFVATEDGYPVAAAFSPDDRMLAIHNSTGEGESAGGSVSVFEVGGTRQQVIPLPVRTSLATGGIAWSPDGRLLVVVDATDDPAGPPTYDLAFLDATGTGRPTPGPIPVGREEVVPLGWRSPDMLLVAWDDGSGRGTNLIAEVPTDGGPSWTVSELSVGEHGWVTGLRLASGLVLDAEIRDPGSPSRGPWLRPLLMQSWPVIMVVVAALLVAGLVIVGRRRASAAARQERRSGNRAGPTT